MQILLVWPFPESSVPLALNFCLFSGKGPLIRNGQSLCNQLLMLAARPAHLLLHFLRQTFKNGMIENWSQFTCFSWKPHAMLGHAKIGHGWHYISWILLCEFKKNHATKPNHQKVGSPYVFVVFFLTKHLKTYPIPKTRHTPHPWVWSRSQSCFSKLVLGHQGGSRESNKTFKSIEPKNVWNSGKLRKVMLIPRAKKASCLTQWCGRRIREGTPLLDKILHQLG